MKSFNPPNLRDAKVVAYDTETSGLDWKKDKLVGHVVTLGPAPDETFYFPVRHEGGGNYDPVTVASWVREEIASRKDLRLVGHHLKFDLHFAANDGIQFVNPLEDTMINAALIDENAFGFSLEREAVRRGVQPKVTDVYDYLASLFGGEASKDQMANFWRTSGDDPKVVEYAAGDGTTTFQVWQAQQLILDHEDLRRVWDVECRVIRTLFRMERRGVRVDEERLAKFGKTLELLMEKHAEKHPFLQTMNVKSSKQIQPLMEERGYTDWPTTPKGAPSFTEAWLSTNPVGQQIVRMRKLRNMVATFIEGAINNHIHDGRIHTTFNQLKMDEFGVTTGRLSSSEPNLQQVPKRDKELAPLFRSCFMPPTDGFLWCTNDFKQQEYVVFAEYTGNEGLVQGYKQEPPIDAHQSVADMCGVERDPTAKRINLGMLYGMGLGKLSKSLGLDENETRRIMNLYHKNIPEARTFLKQAEMMAKRTGYVFTFLGRRRRFPDLAHAHKAGNSIIQGGSADMTKLKMVEVDEFFASQGDVAHLMLQIHDDLNWEVPPDRMDLDAEAKRIMTSFGPEDKITMDVPMRVDSTVAADWGRASFPKYDWEKYYGNV